MRCVFFYLQTIQELKQFQLSEHSKALRDIEDERLKLQEERARLEVEKKLFSKSSGSGMSRAEIDASVKYAEVNIFFYYFSKRKEKSK